MGLQGMKLLQILISPAYHWVWQKQEKLIPDVKLSTRPAAETFQGDRVSEFFVPGIIYKNCFDLSQSHL